MLKYSYFKKPVANHCFVAVIKKDMLIQYPSQITQNEL